MGNETIMPLVVSQPRIILGTDVRSSTVDGRWLMSRVRLRIRLVHIGARIRRHRRSSQKRTGRHSAAGPLFAFSIACLPASALTAAAATIGAGLGLVHLDLA